MPAIDFVYILSGFNQILSSAITILSFSLFVYIIIYNARSAVGQAFAVLLACLCFTYAGDVALFRVRSTEDAIPWLKLQWVGIAFTPAAYLHLADALLRTTNAHSSRRLFAVVTAYIFGLLLLLLVIQSNYVVHDAFRAIGITQFQSGSFFWVFTIYFYTTLIWGSYKVHLARRRCLTSGARRRMTYLGISFAAPALGVYPYMLVVSTPTIHPIFLLTTMFVGNIVIAVMITLMAYSVSFVGVSPPDRVIKHNLAHFLLRGTLVATIVIIIIQVLPRQPQILGLPRDFILQTSIVVVFVLSQLVINMAKPFIDQFLFHQDRLEVAWISELDRRLLTTTDLQQALENVLITLCELLRVRTGFIYNFKTQQGARLEAQVGSRVLIEQAITALNITALLDDQKNHQSYHFISQNQFWYVILQNKAQTLSLGLLGLEARSPEYDLTLEEAEIAAQLLAHAEHALEDRMLQQEVFMTLKHIIPEIERVHRLRSNVPYSGDARLLTQAIDSPVNQQDFPDMVRDALKHYWGGPKLTESPLLGLRVVQESLGENNDNSVHALRSVLTKAIERQRPEGERHLTAAEWLIYNILDMKFVQGMRVRDIANSLSMSESDLYRKQKLAIDEVARTLRDMETQR